MSAERFAHRQIQDAVLRRLEILADATARLSQELKDRHPDIPWREIYGFHNIAAHAYLDIDLERASGRSSRTISRRCEPQ